MIVRNKELVDLIQSLLITGKKVKFTIAGSSMVPFIFNGDKVLITMKPKDLVIGDIVLFEYPIGKYAVHRIIRKIRNHYCIRGDAQFQSVKPVPESSIYGKIIEANHRGRIKVFDHGIWRFSGILWIILFPVSLFSLYGWLFTSKLFKK